MDIFVIYGVVSYLYVYFQLCETSITKYMQTSTSEEDLRDALNLKQYFKDYHFADPAHVHKLCPRATSYPLSVFVSKSCWNSATLLVCVSWLLPRCRGRGQSLWQRPYGLQIQKHLLSGPLQKKFVYSCTKKIQMKK